MSNARRIDAVITWVDGSDPRHAAKKNRELRAAKKLSVNAIPGGKVGTRFANNGELKWCIASIRRHCDWIDQIFLLTDEQVPSFLTPQVCADHRITIVDHRDVFRGFEFALPNFNSQSIETAMFRIDGLSDRFVYFNDDFVVLRPVESSEFFDDGGVVLRGEWRPIQRFGLARKLLSSALNHLGSLVGITRSMAVLPQMKSAQLAGFSRKFLLAPHTPYPLRRSTIEKYFEEYPERFTSNISHKFRDMDQFVPVGLANHLEIARSSYTHRDVKDYLLICFNRDTRAAIEKKLGLLAGGGFTFLCVQGYENASPTQRAKLDALVGGFLECEG